jgi:hypothetical protein
MYSSKIPNYFLILTQQIEQKIDDAIIQQQRFHQQQEQLRIQKEQIRLQQEQLRQQQEEQRRQQQQIPVMRPLQPLIPGLSGTGLAPGPHMPPMGGQAQGQGGFQGPGQGQGPPGPG